MTLLEQVRAAPVLHQAVPGGRVGYRASGHGPALVLLHGIGSGSGSWIMQLAGLAARCRVLAWDAPGYADSTPVAAAQPVAADYVRNMWAWLDALEVQRVTLVGHSLGALIAAAAAATAQPARVGSLILLAPAQGYARASAEVRNRKRDERLAMLARLGPAAMGRERGANMLSATADAQQIELAQAMMGSVNAAGYTQATHLLAGGDLLSDLDRVACPVRVASGGADTITPAAGCEAVARHAGAPYRPLGPVGHLCALEAAGAVNVLLVEALEAA